MNDFEIWPGPMEGVGKGGFITAVNHLKLVSRWMTPFFRVSQNLPKTAKIRTFLEPFRQSGVPVCVQLMGTDPVLLGEAAAVFAGMGIASINLNFGCPSSRVTSSGAGGGALRRPELLSKFCLTVKSFLPPEVSLSVKIRSGWENPDEMENLLPLFAASPAVSKIFFHYRTVKELYRDISPEIRQSRFDRAVELAGKVPLIINGDISSVEEGRQCLQLSGGAGVMIARPWISDPWLLRRFTAPDVPDRTSGREIFFQKASECGISRGGMIELARMLWGSDSDRFRKFIAGPR